MSRRNSRAFTRPQRAPSGSLLLSLSLPALSLPLSFRYMAYQQQGKPPDWHRTEAKSLSPALTPSRPAPPVPTHGSSPFPSSNPSTSQPHTNSATSFTSSPNPSPAFALTGTGAGSAQTIVQRGWVSVKEDGIRAWIWSKRWLILREQTLSFHKNEVSRRNLVCATEVELTPLSPRPAPRRARPLSTCASSRRSRARTSSPIASRLSRRRRRTTSRSNRTRSSTAGWTTSTRARLSWASPTRPTLSTRSTLDSTPSAAPSPASLSNGRGS